VAIPPNLKRIGYPCHIYMKQEEFNLSEKIKKIDEVMKEISDRELGFSIYAKLDEVKADVKEFIKRLKENLNFKEKQFWDKYDQVALAVNKAVKSRNARSSLLLEIDELINWDLDADNIIDTLAGDKLK
jgi:hypothetical protein